MSGIILPSIFNRPNRVRFIYHPPGKISGSTLISRTVAAPGQKVPSITRQDSPNAAEHGSIFQATGTARLLMAEGDTPDTIPIEVLTERKK